MFGSDGAGRGRPQSGARKERLPSGNSFQWDEGSKSVTEKERAAVLCSPRPEGSLSSHAGSLSLPACIASFWFIPSFGRIPSSGSFQERVHGGNLEVCSLYVGN